MIDAMAMNLKEPLQRMKEQEKSMEEAELACLDTESQLSCINFWIESILLLSDTETELVGRKAENIVLEEVVGELIRKKVEKAELRNLTFQTEGTGRLNSLKMVMTRMISLQKKQ